ncbi:LamG-like jellyroll fold domain-containing protein [Granulosicoccus sp. 3-233]|uniref:LamG domain-containing protein n=1 Tax=Granulosicoccus sp. 3-233 TaxID=3417969 RepID=UPI003D32E02B
MPKNRGLNTVVLNPDGTRKAKASHDVYGNADAWNGWASWIGANAEENDIVAVASYDAVRSVPRGGAAATLLNDIGALKAFRTEGPGDWRRVRTPYALLFVMGGNGSREELHHHEGPNAHIVVALNTLHLRGSAFESSEGNQTFLEVNGNSMNMSSQRGLNTLVLTHDLSFKAQSHHDIYGNGSVWNQWAEWVESTAAEGDFVAVASYDAVSNAPGSGAAADLLRSVGALKAFDMTIGADWRRDRASYALLFEQGTRRCLEVSEQLGGPNAHIQSTLVTPLSEGTSRQALSFNGTDNYLSSELDIPETDFTVSIWFKTSNPNCGLFSVDVGVRGAGGHDRNLYLEGGNMIARLWSNETIATSGINYADGQWHRVSHVIGASVSGQQIHVDGVLRASGVKSSSDFNEQTGINIGFASDALSDYFQGEIAEVSLWSVARNEQDNQAWTEQIVGSETDLLAFWTFSERKGSVVRNVVNGLSDATIHGVPLWTSSNDFPGGVLSNFFAPDPEDIRDEGEKLSVVGTTLGNGHEADPPQDLVAEPIQELISSGLMPQYDLMGRLLAAVHDDELVLNKRLLGPYAEIAGIATEVLSVLVSIRNPKVQFLRGKPGMIGAPGSELVVDADDSTALATPEDHSLRVTGDVEVFGSLDYKIQADFFHYKKEPKCSFKFVSGQPLGIGTFLPGVPLIQALKMKGPTLIVCNAGTLYDADLDSGINEGFNFFGNLEIAESDDEALRYVGGLLSVSELAVHAAIDTSVSPRKIILEAAVKREITLLDGAAFKLRFTRSDVGLEISGKPPEPTVSLSNDLVLTLQKGGENTHLVFTGGIKVQAESISGFFTMNGTGRHPDGGLTGKVQNTGEWKEPFGIPGITISQLSLQLGGTYAAPWIDNVGVHGNMKIGDVEGSMSVMVDTNDPDQFVLAGSSNVLTLLQVMSAMNPATFVVYQALGQSVQKTLGKVVDVKMTDVKVNIVPSATSIGGVHFRDEGVTLMGKLSVWGWNASAFINVDTFDGLTVRGDMEPVNIHNIFKITGAQGDPAPVLRMRIAPKPDFAPELYFSARVELLGLSREVRVEANEDALTFHLNQSLGSVLTTRLSCTWGNYNFAATGSINFNLNVTIPTRFGDIPLIDLGFNAAAIVRVGAIDGFFLSLNGDFRFYGKTVTFPELKLSVAPRDFQAVFNAVVKQIRDEAEDLFGPIFKTLQEWADAVKRGAVMIVGEIATVAKDVYNATRDEAVRAYRTLSRGADEVAKGLKTVYKATSEEVGKALRKANYAIEQVAEALEQAFNLGVRQTARVLKKVGYAANQVAAAIRSAFGEALKSAAQALVYAGYAANQVGEALKSIYNATAGKAAEALKLAGYTARQVGAVLKSAYTSSARVAAAALKHARYAVADVGRALRSAFTNSVNVAATALKSAGYVVNDVGRALKGAYTNSAKVAAGALKHARFAVDEVGGALKNVYSANVKEVAAALKVANYTVNEVGYAINSAFSNSAKTAAEALKYAGFAVGEVGGFVKDVYDLGPDALNDALTGAGFAAREIEGFFSSLGGEFVNFFSDIGEEIIGWF